MKSALTQEREPLLDPVNRVSEVMFGLIMAVTIVGSLSIATAKGKDVQTALAAALGCNFAWGLVDAVMYLVRALTERTRVVALAKRIVSTDRDSARQLIRAALSPHVRAITGPVELEGMRRHLLDLPRPVRGGLSRRDYLAAIGVFLLVVAGTFPVVLPFLLTDDVGLAMSLSRLITLAMLFVGGLVLGRYAWHARPVWTGCLMLLLGGALIVAVVVLGG